MAFTALIALRNEPAPESCRFETVVEPLGAPLGCIVGVMELDIVLLEHAESVTTAVKKTPAVANGPNCRVI
jgi:hypothetical protein